VIYDTRFSCFVQCLGQEWLIHYILIQSSYISLQIGAGVCAVPTPDAVATGEVSYCNC